MNIRPLVTNMPPTPPSKAPASASTAPLAAPTASSTPSCSSTIRLRAAEDYLAGFPCTPIAASRPSPTCSKARSPTATVSTFRRIGPGDVQWMTAGSGIIHEEMPQRSKRLDGFQLWANLPAARKMMAPRYRDVPARPSRPARRRAWR